MSPESQLQTIEFSQRVFPGWKQGSFTIPLRVRRWVAACDRYPFCMCDLQSYSVADSQVENVNNVYMYYKVVRAKPNSHADKSNYAEARAM